MYEAAIEKGFYTSGQDIDETNADNPYIVSSQIKDTYYTMKNLIDEFYSGSYSKADSTWGIAEGTIGAVYVTHESPNPRSERLTDEEIDKIRAVAEQIGSGELDFSTFPTEEEFNAGKK